MPCSKLFATSMPLQLTHHRLMCLAVDGTQILGLVNGKSHISPVPSLLLSTISALLLASLFVHRTSFVSHPIIPSQLIALPNLHCAAESGCALGAGICAAMVQGILDPQIQSWGYNSLLAPHPLCPYVRYLRHAPACYTAAVAHQSLPASQ